MDPVTRTFYLGRYNCIEQLGTGPIGETYRAKIYGVAGFEKQFAVKRLHPQLSEDEAFVARFVQAASAFAALEHSGIARVHEVNAQGAHYYIVVDLVRGLDLRRLLDLLHQRGEALSADGAMTIALDVASALAYAHAKTTVLPGGVLHLGLTAPSVMVTYEGDVKLVDVGLLAALMRPGWSDGADALAPTLAYLAPEEWRGEGVDGRADLFSLGVILHELLGGGRAFLSDRAADLRQAIEAGPPAPPPADPRLQQIVTRALEPDAGRRFASIEEMAAAIQGILGGRRDRAHADLSALVRRLAAPRERRTGAFAAVTLPPAATGLTSPVTATKPPPIPPATPHAWAPPTPRPPMGASLSPIPVHNTLAGIGPDDQALVPIELVELPGLPTEKGMQTVASEDAENNRVVRAEPDAVTPLPMTFTNPTESEAKHEAPGATAASGTSGANGGSSPEASWLPPALASPPPSPEPLFAEPSTERPAPVEPAKSTVPGVKLPPTRSGGAAMVLVAVGLLAAVGGMAIYAGLNTGQPNAAGEDRAETAADLAQATARTVAPPTAPVAAQPSTPPVVTRPPTAPAVAPPPTAPAVAPPSTPLVTAPPTPPVVTQRKTPPVATPAVTPPVVTRSSAPSMAPVVKGTAPAGVAPATNGGGFAVTTTPAGATVFVDGEQKGTTPAEITLPAGKHALVVLAEGQKMVKREVDVAPGGKLDLQLEAAKLTAPVAGGDGLKVRCKSRGEIRIFVDGQDSGRSCPNDERISVAPGPHKIGLYSARTGEMHELEREVAEGNNSTRVYVTY
jgi:serine/threonine-protein kinase